MAVRLCFSLALHFPVSDCDNNNRRVNKMARLKTTAERVGELLRKQQASVLEINSDSNFVTIPDCCLEIMPNMNLRLIFCVHCKSAKLINNNVILCD